MFGRNPLSQEALASNSHMPQFSRLQSNNSPLRSSAFGPRVEAMDISSPQSDYVSGAPAPTKGSNDPLVFEQKSTQIYSKPSDMHTIGFTSVPSPPIDHAFSNQPPRSPTIATRYPAPIP